MGICGFGVGGRDEVMANLGCRRRTMVRIGRNGREELRYIKVGLERVLVQAGETEHIKSRGGTSRHMLEYISTTTLPTDVLLSLLFGLSSIPVQSRNYCSYLCQFRTPPGVYGLARRRQNTGSKG